MAVNAPTLPSRPEAPWLLRSVQDQYEDVDVAIVCESTYPYLTGGLSAVVHQICEAQADRTIGIIHITWDESSQSVPLYDVPPNVRWVMPVYQSMDAAGQGFRTLQVKDMGLRRRERRRVAEDLVAALHAHAGGNDEGLWRLYDEGINPLTRRYLLWPLLATQELLDVTAHFDALGMPLAQLFWTLREFFSLAYAVTHQVFPRAGVYHAHTTGAAALLSAAAARQHGTTFLLTEHNLYTRDTINTLLRRPMHLPVTSADWRDLQEYPLSLTGEIAVPDATQRAWMAWFTAIGEVAYRSADLMTYLYPEAIPEAQDLGGVPERSTVLANGIEPASFATARARFLERRSHAAQTGRHIWRLAFAARIVQIKGVREVLDAAALLIERGFSDFELDIMGPDGEEPGYAAACRQRASDLGLDGHVRFLGSVSLKEVFGEYDMLVMGSYNEGQPVVVYEAMAVGLPTIGTDVGGMKALVATTLTSEDPEVPVVVGPAGLLVAPGDPVALADILEQTMRDEELFEAMSAAGPERVEQFFHLSHVMANYSRVYAQLSGEGSLVPPSVLAPVGVLTPSVVVEMTEARPEELPDELDATGSLTSSAP